MSDEYDSDNSQPVEHDIDYNLKTPSGIQLKTDLSELFEDFEQQAKRLISLAEVVRIQIAALEDRVATFRAGEGEKGDARAAFDTFRLICVAPGAHVYIAREQSESSDWFCPDCLADRVTTALRSEPASATGVTRHVCPRCNLVVEVAQAAGK